MEVQDYTLPFFADATSRRLVQEEDDTEERFVAANLVSVVVTTAEAAKAAREDKEYWVGRALQGTSHRTLYGTRVM